MKSVLIWLRVNDVYLITKFKFSSPAFVWIEETTVFPRVTSRGFPLLVKAKTLFEMKYRTGFYLEICFFLLHRDLNETQREAFLYHSLFFWQSVWCDYVHLDYRNKKKSMGIFLSSIINEGAKFWNMQIWRGLDVGGTVAGGQISGLITSKLFEETPSMFKIYRFMSKWLCYGSHSDSICSLLFFIKNRNWKVFN